METCCHQTWAAQTLHWDGGEGTGALKLVGEAVSVPICPGAYLAFSWVLCPVSDCGQG